MNLLRPEKKSSMYRIKSVTSESSNTRNQHHSIKGIIPKMINVFYILKI